MMKEKSITESVLASLDGSDLDLFPFMPYILQDLWEMGADPEAVIDLVKKHIRQTEFHVLDLGCGKGAVSIRLAKTCQCRCSGIDAVPEFIDDARIRAREWGVEDRCCFTVGDARKMLGMFRDVDAIVLGSIGPVFGDHFQTLNALAGCLASDGCIILDDGYLEDESAYRHAVVEKKSDVLRQIDEAGMSLIDEKIMDADFIQRSNQVIFRHIRQRCDQLIAQHPDKKDIFLKYIEDQEAENIALEHEIMCSTMVIRKKD